MPDLTKTLEDRLRAIEDRLEIYNLIATTLPVPTSAQRTSPEVHFVKMA